MGLIIALIVGILMVAMLEGIRQTPLGKVFLFSIFLIILCSFFGDALPISEFISNISSLVVAGIIIYLVSIFIFR